MNETIEEKTIKNGLLLKNQVAESLLYPKPLWVIFNDLTGIPRPSRHERLCIDYVKDFAKQLGLSAIEDSVGNVSIYKPATAGMENCELVILQCHLDMVPEKNKDKVHDFLKDSIEAYVDGDWVKANGTTLGADNGLGVAAALAVLASNSIQHGPLMCLFTIDEETGLTGIKAIGPNDFVKKAILLNLDSEEEGELCIGCAGGADIFVDYAYEQEVSRKDSVAFKISISGLKGGHSGVDINLGRANANKVLFKFLDVADVTFNFRISSFKGGNMRNAIPREAFVIIVMPVEESEEFINFVSEYEDGLFKDFSGIETDLILSVAGVELPEFVMNSESQDNFISSICSSENGVIFFDKDIPDLPRTSSNMGIVELSHGTAKVVFLVRSFVDASRDDCVSNISSKFERIGTVKIEVTGNYPAWKPSVHSEILDICKTTYIEMYNKEPRVYAVHAGLETGYLGGVYPDWDMISFGPTIKYPHSPDEKAEIPSVGRFWNFLIEVLKRVPLKK
ncbi:MAG: aminoacyl-histidine dipeptidase [bacterium]